MRKGFKLSYLFLNKFRTIQNTHISFDHQYRFVQETDGRRRILPESPGNHKLSGPYFYGEHIYSMSCIVGKNGEGKTSTVDFIHESFLLILKDISEGKLKGKDVTNYVNLSDLLRAYYHLEKETEFLVIFSAGRHEFYLSSIPNIETEMKIRPFTVEYRKYINLERYCTVYFSQMRFRSDVARSGLQRGRSRDARAVLQKGEYDNFYLTTEELFGRYKIDLSEERIDAHRSGSNALNFDILIQFVFIYLRKDLVSKCLGADYLKRMRVNSINCEGSNEDYDIMLSDVLDIKSMEPHLGMIDEIVHDPQAYLWPFSSGQYTRFALLARLFWFLAGSESFSETPFLKIFHDVDEFRAFEEKFLNRRIVKNTGAILLFDEGDLCYHPEWQREFVGDIIGLVKACAREDMQIVFTTNSPFMMSDMLREDIVALTRDKKDIDEDVLTFGQNIHTLLAHRFFLDSTIGSVSESVIGWLISLLADPKISNDQEKQSDPKNRDVPEEKKNSILIDMKEEGLSKERAEARYVNRKVYERYEEYCKNRGWDEYSDKSEFLEDLISSIGEEIYRKRLSYRFDLYRNRILENSVVLTAEDADRLLGMLKSDPTYGRDPKMSAVIENLQNKR